MSLRIIFILAIVGILTSFRLQAGYEIADISGVGPDYMGYSLVWIASGSNPITTTEQWDTYTPDPGYIRNTPRTALFNDDNIFSSPGLPPPQTTYMTDTSNYTWLFIAKTQSAMWPYDSGTNPYQEAALSTTPQPGYVKFTSNEKNQEMIFWKNEGNVPEGSLIQRYFVTDQWGNQYIMGATSGTTDQEILDDFNAAVLPAGWSKNIDTLNETLNMFPAYGAGNQAHFNLFRESGDNTYFQMTWDTSGESIANHIEGMPIWGGSINDKIIGRIGDDNLIHGAEGDDLIVDVGNNDTIYGDAGIDTVVLSGDYEDYSLLSYGDNGQELTLSGFGLEKIINGTEFLQFDNITIATTSVPEPATCMLLGLGGLVLTLHFLRRK